MEQATRWSSWMGRGRWGRSREPRRGGSRNFLRARREVSALVFLVDYDHSRHCPFSCSPGPTPVFSFGDNHPRAKERVHVEVGSKILVLW